MILVEHFQVTSQYISLQLIIKKLGQTHSFLNFLSLYHDSISTLFHLKKIIEKKRAKMNFISPLLTSTSVFCYIFEFLTLRDILRSERGCKEWQTILSHSNANSVWRRIYQTNWASTFNRNNLALLGNGRVSWREKVRRVLHLEETWKHGDMIQTLFTHGNKVRTLSFEGRTLATGGKDGEIKLWDLELCELFRTLPAHQDSVLSLLMYNNLLLSGSHDCVIKFWDVQNGISLQDLSEHEDSVWALAISGNQLVSVSDDRTAREWDITTGRCLQVLRGHREGIGAVSICDGMMATGSDDCTVKLWDLTSGKCTCTLPHGYKVNAVQLLSKQLFSSFATLIKEWSLHGKLKRELSGHNRMVSSLWISDNHIATGSYDSTVRVWDKQSGKCLRVLSGHVDKIEAVQCDASRVVSGGTGGEIRVWDFSNPTGDTVASPFTTIVG